MTYLFAFELIGLLLLLSGIIAYVGNNIGRFFGKKRLSVFGLRPRYTALIFTIISGIVIMAVTFSTLILISRDVRTALFGMEKLKESIIKNKAELERTKIEFENSKKELALLQAEKDKLEKLKTGLKKEIDKQRSVAVVFPAGQAVAVFILEGGKNSAAIKAEFDAQLKKLDLDVKRFQIKDIEVDNADYQSTISYLSNIGGNSIIKIISAENAIAGGNILARFAVVPNKIVFHEGDELARGDIDGKKPQADIERNLKDLVDKAFSNAANKGVVPDLSGQVGSVSYLDIYNNARRIRGFGAAAHVRISAAKTVYSSGPVTIKFEVGI